MIDKDHEITIKEHAALMCVAADTGHVIHTTLGPKVYLLGDSWAFSELEKIRKTNDR
jgi:hypothetical protein